MVSNGVLSLKVTKNSNRISSTFFADGTEKKLDQQS